jgi:hypothetical protein
MATNRRSVPSKKSKFRKSFRGFWVFLFLFAPCFLFSQNGNDSSAGALTGSDRGDNSFRVVETPQGPQIIQRLSWHRDENDFRYEVFIEKQDDNEDYTRILHQSRTENFIELRLSSGRYRYRVSVYNLLDQLEYTTNWAVFSIDRARPPALDRISPDHFTLTEKDKPWVMRLRGTNLLPESELSLRPAAGDGAAILPREYTVFPGGNGGRVVFHAADLTAGSYELHIRNPGGFQARLECSVQDQSSLSKTDLFVSAAFVPALPVYGYLNDLFDGAMYPLGFSLRADFLPLKRDWGDLGMEAVLGWNYFSVTKTDLSASAHLVNFQLNLLYHYTLSSYLVLGARLGGSRVSVIDLSYTVKSAGPDPVSTWMFAVNGGISLKWLFHPQGFAELGLDYVHLFSTDGPQGLLFPFVGAGWKY